MSALQRQIEEIRNNSKNLAKHWFLAKTFASSLKFRKLLEECNIEYFLPTMTVTQKKGKETIQIERSKIYNFIFIKDTVLVAKEFAKCSPGISLTYKSRSFIGDEKDDACERLLIVPERQMNSFMKAVGMFDRELPIVKLTDIGLEKGDMVRISDGPFAGIEGMLVTQQGKDGGKVLISIEKELSILTVDIKPEYLSVISFAKDGKHMYKKFDSFLPKASMAVMHFLQNGTIDEKDQATLIVFLKRFSDLVAETVNMKLKLMVYKLICYTCLLDKDLQHTTTREIIDLLPEVNSASNKAFAYTVLYGCTGQKKYLERAEVLIAEWTDLKPKDKFKHGIIDTLALYKSCYEQQQ